MTRDELWSAIRSLDDAMHTLKYKFDRLDEDEDHDISAENDPDIRHAYAILVQSAINMSGINP